MENDNEETIKDEQGVLISEHLVIKDVTNNKILINQSKSSKKLKDDYDYE